MDIVRLFLSLLLPWALGVVVVRVVWHLMPVTDGRPNTNGGVPYAPLLLGYGYVLGMVLTTLVIRAWDMIGMNLDFWGLGAVVLALILLGMWLLKNAAFVHWRILPDSKQSTLHRIVYGVLLSVLFVRFGGALLEILWRPLYAWDAWWHYATKARIWLEYKSLVPIIGMDEWFSRRIPEGYDFSKETYYTISLIQTWIALAWGRWEDTLINLPWLLCGIALGTAFYGQSRLAGVRPVISMLIVYLLLSMPFVDVHMALGGYVELWLASAYALAAMAFFHWVSTRDVRQLVLFLVVVLICVVLKKPGLVWAATFLPAMVVALWPRGGLIIVGLICITVAASVWFGVEVNIPGLGPLVLSRSQPSHIPFLGDYMFSFQPVWSGFGNNLFAFDNWHLFWYAAFFAFLLGLYRMKTVEFRAPAILALAALSVIVVVYFFTPRAEWAVDYTQLNRAVFHITPMLLFYSFWLVRHQIMHFSGSLKRVF